MLLPLGGRARQLDVLALLLVTLVSALVPLLIIPGTLAYFDITPKIALLLLGTALMLLQSRANALNVRAVVSNVPGRWLVGLLAAGWAAFAIATVFSSNRSLSLNGGLWRRMGLIPQSGLLIFVLLAAAWLAGQPDRVRAFLRAVSWSGALTACYGIAQYLGWDPLLPASAYQAGEGVFTIVRPPGTLGHADYFAAWLIVVLFLSLALERVEEKPLYRAVGLTASVLAGIAIVLSGTRAGMLGASIGSVVFVVARRPRFRMSGLARGLASAAALALFFFSSAGLKLRARLHWSLEDARGGARLLLWRDTFQLSEHRPLLGFGPETFATEFPRFESLQLASAYPDFYHESPHNILLDTLAAQGALGLLPLAGLCLLGAWAAIRVCRSGAAIGPPLAAAFAGFLVALQFNAFVLTTELYFYLLAALLVVTAWPPGQFTPSTGRLLKKVSKLRLLHGRGSANTSEHAASAHAQAGLSPSQHPARQALWTLIPAGVAALVLAAYCVPLLISDRALGVTWQRISAGDLAGAANSYATVLRWGLPGASSGLSYSRAMEHAAVRTPIFTTRLFARQQALDAGIRAVRDAEDRQNAWYNLAMLLAGQNDAAGAERALRNAIAWAPNWFKPHWTLARLLALSGHAAEAIEESRIALDCDGGRDPEVADTWKQLQAQIRAQPAAGH
jgi:putative inorganic carbon (HCO3(-)) transporter